MVFKDGSALLFHSVQVHSNPVSVAGILIREARKVSKEAYRVVITYYYAHELLKNIQFLHFNVSRGSHGCRRPTGRVVVLCHLSIISFMGVSFGLIRLISCVCLQGVHSLNDCFNLGLRETLGLCGANADTKEFSQSLTELVFNMEE